jgi:hypothetical protein
MPGWWVLIWSYVLVRLVEEKDQPRRATFSIFFSLNIWAEEIFLLGQR